MENKLPENPIEKSGFTESGSVAVPHGFAQKAEKSNSEKLLEELRGLELTPEQTQDDISPSQSRDEEILGDVPPHHGSN